MSEYFEFCKWGNGNSPLGYTRSRDPYYWSPHQFAAALGVNQGTARVYMSGRDGRPQLGEQLPDGNWRIKVEVGLDEVRKKRGLFNGHVEEPVVEAPRKRRTIPRP